VIFYVFSKIIKSKSNLRYTRLIPFRVSRVSSAHLRGFAPRPTRDLNSIPPALEANDLPLVNFCNFLGTLKVMQRCKQYITVIAYEQNYSL